MKDFPKKQATLETDRLRLRPLQDDDAISISTLANDKNVSRYLSSLPYPYRLKDAQEFIKKSKREYEEGEQLEFAIIKKKSNNLIGMMGLDMSIKHHHGTIGYWIGKKYWGRGYTTEAGFSVVKFAFKELELYRITSHHFHSNPNSGKVMRKIGLKHEGTRLGHYKKGEEYFDIFDYGLLRSEFLKT